MGVFMKALELLYQYHQADKIAGGYMSKPITEAIEELEELQQSIKYSIEEIEWALAKPDEDFTKRTNTSKGVK